MTREKSCFISASSDFRVKLRRFTNVVELQMKNTKKIEEEISALQTSSSAITEAEAKQLEEERAAIRRQIARIDLHLTGVQPA